ncbi:hypothetical protein PI124_g3274 [Phytophthora idaei]|nr:hypothetical protein PI124_g3274 [Phytophthora idaei]
MSLFEKRCGVEGWRAFPAFRAIPPFNTRASRLAFKRRDAMTRPLIAAEGQHLRSCGVIDRRDVCGY